MASGIARFRSICPGSVEFFTALKPDVAGRPFESNTWRSWFNPHINVYRHGVMLEELSSVQRNAFLDLLRATLSARGYAQARDIMRLNELLAELTGRADDYGEWPYFASFFGVPSVHAPWGLDSSWVATKE